MNSDLQELMQKAQNGDADSQYELGNLYQNGEGVEMDIEKAIEWWQKAAKNGHKKASDLIKKLDIVLKLIDPQ